MSNAFKISGNCFFLIFITLLLNGCSFAHEKHKIYTVEIKDMKFVPNNLSVNKGDTVEWINRDMMAHDVTEEATKAWTSSQIPPGGSWKMAVTANTNYYCSIHMVMKGKLELK